MLESFLKGAAKILNEVADSIPKTEEEKLQANISRQIIHNDKLQTVLVAFKDKYGFGMNSINVDPIIESNTLNITKWQATTSSNKLIVEGKGLNDIYDYFAIGVSTIDPEIIKKYKVKAREVNR